MAKSNFSRAFQTIEVDNIILVYLYKYLYLVQDNTESMIGDMIHLALDTMSEMMAFHPEDCSPDLLEAFNKRDILQCLVLTHQTLGHQYLDAGEIFQDLRSERKTRVRLSGHESTLEDLNQCVRVCETSQLCEILTRRGDALLREKKHHEALADYEQCLELSDDDQHKFQLHYKVAQTLAKMSVYSSAVDHLKLSLKHLQTASISTKVRTRFSQTIIQSLKKLQGKTDADVKDVKTPEEVFSVADENDDVPGKEDL